MISWSIQDWFPSSNQCFTDFKSLKTLLYNLTVIRASWFFVKTQRRKVPNPRTLKQSQIFIGCLTVLWIENVWKHRLRVSQQCWQVVESEKHGSLIKTRSLSFSLLRFHFSRSNDASPPMENGLSLQRLPRPLSAEAAVASRMSIPRRTTRELRNSPRESVG